MIERYVTISNFRSIGHDKNEIFELNYLMDKDSSYGGLVTLIGENNSGKSKILEEVLQFCNSGLKNVKSLILENIEFENLGTTIALQEVDAITSEPHMGEAVQ